MLIATGSLVMGRGYRRPNRRDRRNLWGPDGYCLLSSQLHLAPWAHRRTLRLLRRQCALLPHRCPEHRDLGAPLHLQLGEKP